MQLDKHIEKFRVELQEMPEQKVPQEESQSEPIVTGIPKKRKIAHKGEKGEGTATTKKARKTAEDASYMTRLEPPIEQLPLEAHAPDEQKYCSCQQVVEGEMVACDNQRCKYKWFHFKCVGLLTAPKTDEKWYCPECSIKMQNKHKY